MFMNTLLLQAIPTLLSGLRTQTWKKRDLAGQMVSAGEEGETREGEDGKWLTFTTYMQEIVKE